jgi:dynactin complex subunit
VDGTSGEWIGVEWDNAARGTHDGTVNGRRYFHCERAETTASMLRAPRLRKGTTLLNAIHDKYVRQEGSSTDIS